MQYFWSLLGISLDVGLPLVETVTDSPGLGLSLGLDKPGPGFPLVKIRSWSRFS